MKYLKLTCLLLIFIALAGSALPVHAQDYYFQVPAESVIVTVNKDGSESIDYYITFQNDQGAHVIDVVDIGMPNSDYVLSSMTANIDGTKLTKITKSDYVSPGISVYLGDHEIPAGGSGTLYVHIDKVKNVIYSATEQESESYGSLVFEPNYFDSQYCHGNTKLQVTLILPEGLQTSEPRYYTPSGGWPGSSEPESGVKDNRIYYTWYSEQANPYSQYQFGASFPARLLDANAINTSNTYQENPSSSTSFSFDSLCPWVMCLGFLGFFGLMIYSATIGAKKRKLQYLPPKISIEGQGIKRGLTPVEAGILMEQPMDKIMTMILFGLLKKEAAEVVTKDPLEIKQANPLPEGLYAYETDFLAAFTTTNTTQKRKLLQTMMINLIKSVGEKMKGFSKKDTLAFYQDIMKRAWEQVETAATPEVKGQVYEDVMDWTMLDSDYEKRTTQTFNTPVFIPAPTWWWRYDPAFPRTSTVAPTSVSTSGSGSTGGGGRVSLPSLPGSAFAASVVGGAQNFASNLLGNVTSFTSGVTNVTNPPPPPSTYRGGGSSGGHSCACACACAGCACACAGGGR